MTQNKIIVTSCVAMCTGAVSALVYNMMRDSKKKCKGTQPTEDNELSANDLQKCRCPFASVSGVALTGGVVSGALTWVYYPY